MVRRISPRHTIYDRLADVRWLRAEASADEYARRSDDYPDRVSQTDPERFEEMVTELRAQWIREDLPKLQRKAGTYFRAYVAHRASYQEWLDAETELWECELACLLVEPCKQPIEQVHPRMKAKLRPGMRKPNKW